MKKLWIILGVVVLAVIVIASVLGGKKKPNEVYTEKAARRTIAQTVLASGEIQPKNKVNVQAHVVARIDKLYFKEGDMVTQGQRIVELEKQEYLLQRDQYTDALASARAGLALAEAQSQESSASYARTKRLFEEKLATEEALDQATSAYKSSLARVDSAREDMKRSEKMLAEAQDRLTKTTILAPMTGKVVERDMKEGEVVVSGTNIPGSVIAVVADLTEILAEVDVIESEIARLKVGLPSTVSVDALPDKTFNGTIEEIAESAFKKQDVSYFKVKVRITDDPKDLRPGMTAKAKIKVQEKLNVLSVPVQAVLEKDKKKFLFLFDGRKAKKLSVTAGLSDDLYSEVEGALKEGQSVITGPARILKDMEDGAVVKEKAKPKEDEKEKGGVAVVVS
jgi:HlyD family secretion protein